jgi:hypothetical protein
MDFCRTNCANRCYLTFFHSRTFNCTSKTTGWFTKGLKLIPPHANKVLLKVARILIYIDGLLSVANCIGRCYLTFFHFPSSIVKRLAGSQRSWNWSTCHANKVLLQGAHAFLYTLMDFFQSRKLCPSCYLTFFHFPERSIALVKRLAGSPKGWNWSCLR